MFLPTGQRPASDNYDCIVIGSGPAGMTVALELEKVGRRVLLIESEAGNGDLALSVGYGHFGGNYWNAHWVRALGGTSNAWAGFVATMREIDFDHPSVGVPWPVERAVLQRYYRRAAPYLNRRATAIDFERPIVSGWIFRPFSWGAPVRFGDQYRATLQQSKRVDVALGCSVVGFGATPSRSSIVALRAFDHRASTPFELSVRPAQAVVVAAGGIGNAQLLLQPPEEGGVPVGNESGQVGKFLMEHPHVYDAAECVTDLVFSRYAPPRLFGRVVDAVVLDNATETAAGLFGCSLQFGEPNADDDMARHFSSRGRTFHHFQINARSEMRPSATNRVFLTAERSRSGLFHVAARCVLDADDLRNIEETIRRWGQTLTALDRGRVRVMNDAIYESVTGGGHIMGTTRMGRDRSTSVVDDRCRVHGYGNFYVAGSSVFPTGGYANPTFTIVALSVLIADEIARQSS
jgi:choline dehydrogenase-like flavoprotein